MYGGGGGGGGGPSSFFSNPDQCVAPSMCCRMGGPCKITQSDAKLTLKKKGFFCIKTFIFYFIFFKNLKNSLCLTIPMTNKN
jgi:hypothetical protein